jgi:hypothetical protein
MGCPGCIRRGRRVFPGGRGTRVDDRAPHIPRGVACMPTPPRPVAWRRGSAPPPPPGTVPQSWAASLRGTRALLRMRRPAANSGSWAALLPDRRQQKGEGGGGGGGAGATWPCCLPIRREGWWRRLCRAGRAGRSILACTEARSSTHAAAGGKPSAARKPDCAGRYHTSCGGAARTWQQRGDRARAHGSRGRLRHGCSGSPQ